MTFDFSSKTTGSSGSKSPRSVATQWRVVVLLPFSQSIPDRIGLTFGTTRLLVRAAVWKR